MADAGGDPPDRAARQPISAGWPKRRSRSATCSGSCGATRPSSAPRRASPSPACAPYSLRRRKPVPIQAFRCSDSCSCPSSFRREGWDARAERDIKGGSFRDTVLNEWFDLVEVLATSDHDLDAIASGIRLIRRGSPNPSVGVIACGRVFSRDTSRTRPDGRRRSLGVRSAVQSLGSQVPRRARTKSFVDAPVVTRRRPSPSVVSRRAAGIRGGYLCVRLWRPETPLKPFHDPDGLHRQPRC